MYSPALWSYFHNTAHRGVLEDANASGQSQYPRCGDRLRLDLKIEGERIVSARYQAYGCGAVVAAASLGTELLTDLTVEQARQLSSFQLDEKLGGLPPSKRHAYLMFLECLHEALPPSK